MKKEEEWEEFFEDDATRELKQIFQGQAAMTETVRELHRKMDEIIGKQPEAYIRTWDTFYNVSGIAVYSKLTSSIGTVPSIAGSDPDLFV